MSSFFVDENKNFMSNYPQGEIVSYDLKTGKKIGKYLLVMKMEKMLEHLIEVV